MDYTNLFNTITDLYKWMKGLQVLSNLQVINTDSEIELQYIHPILGRRNQKIARLDIGIIRLDGLKFKIEPLENGQRDIICMDDGAIFDPIDNNVPGDHYATSYFGLLVAILYFETFNEKYLNDVEHALSFYLLMGSEYCNHEWASHWEFDNYAWVKVLDLFIQNSSDSPVMKKIEGYLHDISFHKIPYATNWKLLQINALLGLLHLKTIAPGQKAKYLFKGFGLFILVWTCFLKDGCIEDLFRKSRSLQYHIFSTALIGNLYQNLKWKMLKRKFLASANYARAFIDPQGVINYKGRGQRQIFAYGPMIYILILMISEEPTNHEIIRDLDRVYMYLLSYKRAEGNYPLVLNGLSDAQKIGWYSYNHLTVYNAFLAAWLGLALTQMKQCSEELLPQEIDCEQKMQNLKFADSKVLLTKNRRYFFCISGGEDKYETDCGVSPHHFAVTGFGPLISCPGGPDQGEYGKYRNDIMDINFWSPIISCEGKYFSPGNRKATRFHIHENELQLEEYYTEKIKVKRKIIFKNETIYIFDSVLLSKKLEMTEKFRIYLVNIPLIWGKGYSLNKIDNYNNFSIQTLTNKIEVSLKGDKTLVFNEIDGEGTAGLLKVIQGYVAPFDAGSNFQIAQEWNLGKY